MLQIPMHVCDHSLKLLLLLLQPGCLASGELNGGLPATTPHRFGTGQMAWLDGGHRWPNEPCQMGGTKNDTKIRHEYDTDVV